MCVSLGLVSSINCILQNNILRLIYEMKVGHWSKCLSINRIDELIYSNKYYFYTRISEEL